MRIEIKRNTRPQLALPPSESAVMSLCQRSSMLTWEGSIDGRLACLWGLIPPTLLSERAYLWLYTTPLVKEHTFIFVRYSQLLMEEMLEEYPIIVGHTKVGEAQSIRWLKWLGAVYGEPEGLRIPFTIRKKNG